MRRFRSLTCSLGCLILFSGCFAKIHQLPAHPESTADQFFDESQFESYRRLGEHIATAVLPPSLAASPHALHQVLEELRDRSENWCTGNDEH